jgi:ABC-2 type transport system ATP-binding protein
VVEGLSVHTPDLDDVFLALTGHPNGQEEASFPPAGPGGPPPPRGGRGKETTLR